MTQLNMPSTPPRRFTIKETKQAERRIFSQTGSSITRVNSKTSKQCREFYIAWNLTNYYTKQRHAILHSNKDYSFLNTLICILYFIMSVLVHNQFCLNVVSLPSAPSRMAPVTSQGLGTSNIILLFKSTGRSNNNITETI